jgi:hypothetical protein
MNSEMPQATAHGGVFRKAKATGGLFSARTAATHTPRSGSFPARSFHKLRCPIIDPLVRESPSSILTGSTILYLQRGGFSVPQAGKPVSTIRWFDFHLLPQPRLKSGYHF